MLNNNGQRTDPCGTPWSNSHRHLFILFSLYFTLTFNNFYKMQSQLTSIINLIMCLLIDIDYSLHHLKPEMHFNQLALHTGN